MSDYRYPWLNEHSVYCDGCGYNADECGPLHATEELCAKCLLDSWVRDVEREYDIDDPEGDEQLDFLTGAGGIASAEAAIIVSKATKPTSTSGGGQGSGDLSSEPVYRPALRADGTSGGAVPSSALPEIPTAVIPPTRTEAELYRGVEKVIQAVAQAVRDTKL